MEKKRERSKHVRGLGLKGITEVDFGLNYNMEKLRLKKIQ